MEVPTEGGNQLKVPDNFLTPAEYATSDAGITSDEEHATKFKPPQESAVDNALLGNKTPIVLVRGTSATDATRDNNGGDDQGKQGSLQQLKNVEKMLDEEGGDTSDTAVTSDEEHATKYKPPQESAVDNALLGNETPIVLVRSTPATDATRDNTGGNNQEKQGSLQQLKNVEKMLDEEGCGTSDTAVTSDEEITTHKVPQESTVDKDILEKKGVISYT